jgi:hypothetical protein
MDSYQKIVTIKTWGDFFSCMKALEESVIQSAMLFWMRGDVPPLYENHANIRGGCYSIRVNRQKAVNYFLLYTIVSMMGKAVSNGENVIQGVSISPKRIFDPKNTQSFNVIKVWNKDCMKFCKSDELIILDNINQSSEIVYTPHTQKKL